MRVTIINQFYVPDISPTAHLAASLAEGLAAQGHTVTVVTSRGGYVESSRTGETSGSNPRVIRVWTPRLGKKSILKRCLDYASFYLLCAWRMAALRRQDAVICLTTPPYIAWTGWLHCRLHPGTKLILWNMDCYPDAAERAGVIKKGGALSRIMRAMNRSLLRRLDHLICLDEAMAELMVGQYGPKQRGPERVLRTSIIPNWEKASFFPADQVPTAWEQSAPLALQDKFVVLYLGNTGVGHPFETVIAAAKKLRDLPVVFLFVGGGKRWAWLQQQKAKEGLENIILHPYVQKELTAGVMAAADGALITLADDMLGVMSPSKLHANLAMGLPVIYVGPKKSNVDAAIERFGAGVSLPQGDASGLAEFIRLAMGDPAKLCDLQRRARAAFEAAYCDTQTLPQFHRILASPAASRGRRNATLPSANESVKSE